MPYFILFFLTFVFTPVYGQNISPALQKNLQTEMQQDVMVYFEGEPQFASAFSIVDRDTRVQFVVEELIQNAKISQQSVKLYLQSAGLNYSSFFVGNAMLVKNVAPSVVRKLSRLPHVREVGLDVSSELKLPFPIPWPEEGEGGGSSKPIGIPSHLKTIRADKVWQDLGVRGEGIVVAGQDTGFFWEHNALKNKYRGFQNGQVSHDYNWLDAIVESPCSTGGSRPCDDKDHGTHTMGTMVGDDGQGNQIGVAPEAQWMGCRNMKDGVGTVSSYMRCFDFFLAPYPIGGDPQQDGRPELAPHIVNNSWSCPTSEGCTGQEFAQVVQAYKAAGVMLVAAAGNNGPNCGTVSNQPGTYAGDILVVGAWNSFLKEIAFFSALGPSPLYDQLAPNLIAPGGFVKSSLASGPNAYDDKAGTSMASPQVAGVVALLWSYRPELIGQIETTIEIIQESASPLTGGNSCPGFPSGQSPNAVHGHGMLDAYQALTTN